MSGVNSDGILGIFLGSFAAMVKVFLTCAVGVLAAIYPKGDPLLPDVALRNFSRLVTFVLVGPLIIVALGSALTPRLLSQYAILIPFCLFNMFVSNMLFRMLRPLHQRDDALRTASMVATMSPNIISMPLMLLQSLCELKLVNDDYDGESEDCFNEATSMLFVYSIGFNLLYWAVLYPILMDVAEGINNPGTDSASTDSGVLTKWHHLEAFAEKAKSTVSRAVMTPAMIGIYVGLFIGLVPGLRGLVFGEELSPLTPVGGTLRVLAAPVVCLNTLIMAASLAKVRLPPSVLEDYFWWAAAASNWVCWTKPGNISESNSRNNIIDSNDPVSDKPVDRRAMMKRVRENSRRFKQHVLQRMGLRRRRALTWTDMDASAVVTGVEFVQTDTRGYVLAQPDDADAGGGGPDDSNTDDADAEGGGPDDLNTEGSNEGREGGDYLSDGLDIEPSDAPSRLECNAIGEVQQAYGPRSELEGCMLKEDESTTVTLKTFLVHVLARLILPPIATIVLMRLAMLGGVVGENARMMQLVVILESANPSAQMVIVCLNQLGVPELASQISLIYVGQYLLSIITLTFWASVAMNMVYSNE